MIGAFLFQPHQRAHVGASLLAKALYQNLQLTLMYRFREQARSHRDLQGMEAFCALIEPTVPGANR